MKGNGFGAVPRMPHQRDSYPGPPAHPQQPTKPREGNYPSHKEPYPAPYQQTPPPQQPPRPNYTQHPQMQQGNGNQQQMHPGQMNNINHNQQPQQQQYPPYQQNNNHHQPPPPPQKSQQQHPAMRDQQIIRVSFGKKCFANYNV